MIQSLLKRRALLNSQKENGEGGFTLIELLIVIIVLGILAAIVVFAVGTTRDDAVQASCKTDAKAVQLSAEAIKVKSGSYPLTAAVADLSDPAKGGLLKAFPSSSSYTLTYTSAAGTSYAITSDKDPGTGTVTGCDQAG